MAPQLYTDSGPQRQFLKPPVNGKIRVIYSSTFQGNFNFQGLFKTVLCFQVLFKPVRTLPSAYFFKNQLFQKYSFRNTIRVSNSLDPDQTRHFVVPDLDPNCLQKLSANNTHKYKEVQTNNCFQP